MFFWRDFFQLVWIDLSFVALHHSIDRPIRAMVGTFKWPDNNSLALKLCNGNLEIANVGYINKTSTHFNACALRTKDAKIFLIDAVNWVAPSSDWYKCKREVDITLFYA